MICQRPRQEAPPARRRRRVTGVLVEVKERPRSAREVATLALPQLRGLRSSTSARRDDRDAVAARGRVAFRAGGGGRRPGGDGHAGPGGRVGDDQPARAAGRGLAATVAGGAEDAAGVAAPVVAPARAEEDVLAAAVVLAVARARRMQMVPDLPGDQLVEEWREIDGQTGLPARAAVGVVLRRQPVKPAAELEELPFEVDLAGPDEVALQAYGLAPAHPGVGDGDDHREVLVPARGSAVRSASSRACSGVAQARGGVRSSRRPVRRPRLRGRSAGL